MYYMSLMRINANVGFLRGNAQAIFNKIIHLLFPGKRMSVFEDGT